MSGLGLNQYHASGDANFAPRVGYNAKSRAFTKVEREQDSTGAWGKQEVELEKPTFAADFGTLNVGWAYFPPTGSGLRPSIIMVPFGSPMPAKPDDLHKAGFRLMIRNPKELGPEPREFVSTAGVTVAGIEELWTKYAAAPEAAAGKIPVVQLASTRPVQSKFGTNYLPVFEIKEWVDRNLAFGERTVAAPAAKTNGAPPKTNGAHHAPPVQAMPEPPAHVTEPTGMPDEW
jgi:hypothetical protein